MQFTAQFRGSRVQEKGREFTSSSDHIQVNVQQTQAQPTATIETSPMKFDPRSYPVATAITLVCLFMYPASGQESVTEPQNEVAIHEAMAKEVLGYLADDEIDKSLQVIGAVCDSQVSLGQPNPGLSVAAAAIHRELAQLSTSEQYDLLRSWSLPNASQSAVRLLTVFVPTSAPPKAFGRSIDERPRDSTFAVGSIGAFPGLFCSGWMLVQAADDIGRIGRLMTELEPLVQKKIPGADTLLMLARIKFGRSDMSELNAALEKRLERLVAQKKTDSTDLLLAVSALERSELQGTALRILDALNQDAVQRPEFEQPLIRMAHAIATQVRLGKSDPSVLNHHRLKYWVTADSTTARSSQTGMPMPMWLSHENHLLHVAGSNVDTLFSRFPLQGEFSFSCGALMSKQSNGGLVFGGFHFQPQLESDAIQVLNADDANPIRRSCPFFRKDSLPDFNRLGIQSDSDLNVSFTVNHNPLGVDRNLHQNSPWLGLRSLGEHRSVFRNVTITGTPTIPSQINLVESGDLRGWQSTFFASDGWNCTDGVIEAKRMADKETTTGQQSLLRYQRPLLDGETISYEFYYQPDETHVHPALGRIAFLIDPKGMRVHWITDGDLEWTGLTADNDLLEPLSRRGPRKPPVKPEWNQVSVGIADGKANVSLNGELVYQRPANASGEPFGFFYDPSKTNAKIRNVKMTGDWPDKLPEAFRAAPLALVE